MINAFISYSHKDAEILSRLHTHLAVLRRSGQISGWYDRSILAGGVIDTEISKELENCNLFLAIVSPDFLDSSYCYEKEMNRAFERHDAGQIRLIPIIVEPCDWIHTPLSRFKALPKDGKPISEWPNPNNAYQDIVSELRRIVSDLESKQRPNLQNEDLPSSKKTSQPSRFKVKKSFDEIDKKDFSDKAYQIIRDQFKLFIDEIDNHEDVRAQLKDIDSTAFTCTILNKAKKNSVGHLTVHGKTSNFLGDMSFSYSADASPNTTNGTFQVRSDDYDLYLGLGFPMIGRENRRLNPIEAALLLWKDLLNRADIEFA